MLISVIIPALNEESCIRDALERALAAPGAEVTVVDGGSADGTVRVSESFGVKVLSSNPGRSAQMNAGAWAATGEALLFLHADTLLPEGYDGHVRRELSSAGTVAGAFALGIGSPRRSLRVIEALANFRSGRLHMPYGDQAIFVRADIFREVGGYADMPIMEDFELMRRVGRLGRVAHVPVPVITSARRWEGRGVLKTTLINQAIIAGYFLGVKAGRMRRP
jgi:rSAM/selenodomain-associated transferase 2